MALTPPTPRSGASHSAELGECTFDLLKVTEGSRRQNPPKFGVGVGGGLCSREELRGREV